jgi:hypothetical protein
MIPPSRDLAARYQEIAGGVVPLEEGDVRGHVLVDLGEVGLVDELDDEHDRLVCCPTPKLACVE